MVAERTHEIGGCSTRRHFHPRAGGGATLTAIGLVVGLIDALVLRRFLQALLFAVSPTDPLTLRVVAALLGLVALLARVVPARRAVGVDPMSALRAK